MLSKKVEKALNEQMEKEAYASHAYLAMASWCETEGLRGSSRFLHEQSSEEREHMLKLFKYINESGGKAILSSIKAPAVSFSSLKQVFETTLAQEQDVTQSIYELVELSMKDKDHAAFNFLQWYVTEQHEEESLLRSILDIFKLAGKEEKCLLIIDKEIAGIRVKN